MRCVPLAIALSLALASTAQAQTKLNLSASAERKVANDTMQVVLGTENTAPGTQTLYAITSEALSKVAAKAKSHPEIKIKPGLRSMTPVYSEVAGEESKIVAWRERADLQLESQDFPAMYKLIEESLSSQKTPIQVRGLSFSLSEGATKAVGAELYITALKNIKNSAAVVSSELGSSAFDINELSFNGPYASGVAPVMMMRAKAQSMASPASMEAGESNVRVDLSGSFTPTNTPNAH